MKFFLSPFTSALVAGAYFVTLLAVPLGRFWSGHGYQWTLLGSVILAVLFAVVAREWPAFDQMGASFNRWMNSAATTALLASIPLAGAATASAVYNQLDTPHYMFYDPLLVTNSQTVSLVDDAGELYSLSAAGQDAATIAITFGTTLLLYLAACFAGIALGLAAVTHRAGVPVLGVVVAALGYAITRKLVQESFAHYGTDGVVWIPEQAGVAAEIAAIIVAALVITGFAALLISRTPQFVK